MASPADVPWIAEHIALYQSDPEDSHVIIASKGGAPVHPSWFENLMSNPECHIQVGEKSVNVRARIIPDGEEREKIWDQMVEIYSPYTDYKKATDRQIPVVVLDPV